MKRYIAWLDRYKGWIVTLLPALILLGGVALKEMAFESGYRVWFAEGSKPLEEYDAFRRVFGSDDLLVIAFADEEGVFRKKPLESVERITRALERTPRIERVLSLTSVPWIGSDPELPDEVLVEPFVTEPATRTAEYFEAKRRRAASDALITPLFVNADATATLIAARIVPGARESGTDADAEIRGAVDRIMEAEHALTGYDYRLSGALAIQTEFTGVMIGELLLFIPLIAVTVSLFLWLIFRRLSAVAVPLGVVGLAIVAVVAGEVAAGYRINNFTADIPVVLLAVGVATTVHVFTSWHRAVNRGEGRIEAVEGSVRKNMLPLFLTALTTAIGFGSLAVSDIVPVYTLGLATAAGVLLIFVLSVFLAPAMLLYVRHPAPMKERTRFDGGYGRFITAHRGKIVAGSLLLVAALGAGVSQLRVDSNLIRFLDDTVEVRQATDFIAQRITGPMRYEIVVDSGQAGGVKAPEFLRDVETFSHEFETRFPEITRVGSLLEVVKRFNEVMHGGDPLHYAVPASREEAAQYLFFYSLSLPQGLALSDSMDVDERRLRISADTTMNFSRRDLEMIAWAEAWWRQHTPYTAKVYGQTAMFATMQSDVTDTLVESIGLSIVLVSAVMFLVFRNIRLLPLYIVPNVLPFFTVLGLMGWLDIAVDLGVAISGAVILGIAVDDTMHFLVRYFEARKKGLCVEKALDAVMEHAGAAIMITTFILTLSFSMLVFSRFVPNAHFGVVTASALLIAVVVDLLLLPALLVMAEGRPEVSSKPGSSPRRVVLPVDRRGRDRAR